MSQYLHNDDDDEATAIAKYLEFSPKTAKLKII